MNKPPKIILALIAGGAAAGIAAFWPRLPSAASTALANADRYELLSLDWRQAEDSKSDVFHGHRILGRVEVRDPATRDRLVHALRGGVESVLSSRNRCFNPRHGLRVASAGKVVDLLICFECRMGIVWDENGRGADWTTDRSPQATFDQVLTRAGVPLPTDD